MLFLDSMTQSAYKQITDPSHQHHHPVPAVTLVYTIFDTRNHHSVFVVGGCRTFRGHQMLQIYIDKILNLKLYGFEETIRNTMGTVHLLMQPQVSSENDAIIRTGRELSTSVVIELFCESGLLRGDPSELSVVKHMFLNRLFTREDTATQMNDVPLTSVLHHVTSVVMRGNMFQESPIVENICCQSGNTLDYGVEVESWPLLQQSVLLGEVLRLSFVLEENLKKRAIVGDNLIAIIMHDVIENAQVILKNTIQYKNATGMRSFANNVKEKFENDSFSQMISRNMVNTIVSAVLRMETPGVAKYAHSLFCVNLLELYGEQYMQWDAKQGRSVYERVNTPKKKDPQRILEKQALLIKTIKIHGREMVHEQVRKMINNVSGLFSSSTDMTCCTQEMNQHINDSLHVLCTNQTPQNITRAVLQYDTENKGIHLLRKSSGVLQDRETVYTTPVCMPQRILPNSFAEVVENANNMDNGDGTMLSQIFWSSYMTTAWHMEQPTTEMIPSNLWYILKNIEPMMSNRVSNSDPRYDIIQNLRRSMVVSYLEIVYNFYTSHGTSTVKRMY